MADGKWISGLKADTPLVKAARRVLQVRLQVVRRYLPLALKQPDKDTEHVHQLRVGTRRAAAALKIFRCCLRRKGYQRARKVLRALRRAAGEARDWDVFQDMLSAQLQQAKATHEPGLDFLIGYTRGQRDAAQLKLVQAAGNKQADIAALTTKTIKSIRKPRKRATVLIELARPLLKDLLDNLNQAMQEDLTQYENLHRVRIAGKRLRYAMEVFAPCFERTFRDKHYAAVEQLQEILGEANDSSVAGQRLELIARQLQAGPRDVWSQCRAGIHRVRAYHRRRLSQQKSLFQKWWRAWERSGADAALGAASR